MIIAVDFDDTIVEDIKAYPKFGKLLPDAKRVLTRLHEADDHILVLYTLRDNGDGYCLRLAIDFLKKNNMDFFKLPIDFHYNECPKFPFDVLIDDRNVGGFPGWEQIEKIILGGGKE